MTRMATWEVFKYLCDRAAITHEVKVATYHSTAGAEGSERYWKVMKMLHKLKVNLFTQPPESQWWSQLRHTHSNIPSNALPLGADCIPRVAETPWLRSATPPPPSTVSPQQWLFNKLLARRETTLFNTQMRRQKEAFSYPGVGGEEGVIHSDYTQSLLSQRISKWGVSKRRD